MVIKHLFMHDVKVVPDNITNINMDLLLEVAKIQINFKLHSY